MFQHYLDLNQLYTGTEGNEPTSPTPSSGYLRMRGSEYIRMKAAQDDDVASLHVPNSTAYADIARQRLPSTRTDHIPLRPMERVPAVPEEEDALDVVVRSPSPKLPRHVPKTSVPAAYVPKRSSDSSGNSGLQSGSEEADDQPSPMDPFIPKMNHLNGGAQFRNAKKGCKSNDSVVSDASSGFHSDYIPEDNNSMPPNYEAVVGSQLAESNV